MKKVLCIITALTIILTAIPIFAANNNYISLYEDFSKPLAINCTTEGNMSITGTTSSAFTYELSGSFVSNTADVVMTPYEWVKQGTAYGYNGTEGLFLDASRNHGGKYSGVTDGKLRIKFKKVSSGKILISFRANMIDTFKGASADFGSLKNSATDQTAVKITDGNNQSNMGSYYFDGKTKEELKAFQVNTWYKVTYIANLDNKTYDLYCDNKKIKEGNLDFYDTTVTSVDCLEFCTGSGHTGFTKRAYLDDIVVGENPDTNTRTVNFYQNNSLIESTAVPFGKNAECPTPIAPKGTYFLGWFSDPEGETPVNLDCVLEDTNAYAIYTSYIIREDFGDSTSFRIDAANKTVKTNSGFTFQATDNCFSALSVDNGSLFMDARNKATNNTLNISFNEISSGKANISFRFKIDTPLSNPNTAVFGALNNINQHFRAKDGKLYLGTTAGIVNTPYNREEFSHDENWHRIEYEIDQDLHIYSVYFDNTSYGPYTLNSSSANNIKFEGFSHAPSNMSYHIDDLCIILNSDDNIKNHTVTYYDSDGSKIAEETVKTGHGASNIPNMEGNAKIFTGWYIAPSEDTKANLTCIINDIAVYAGYIEEIPAEQDRIGIINVGETIKQPIDADMRSFVTESFNGKTFIYGTDFSTGHLYQYDVTNPRSVTKAAEYSTFELAANSTHPIFFKDNCLFIGDASHLKKVPVNSDGSLDTQAEIVLTTKNNQNIDTLQIVANKLFIGSQAINMYDISNISEITWEKTIFAQTYRSFAVEAVSNIRYRLYTISAFNTTSVNNNAIPTIKFSLSEIIEDPKQITVNSLFDGIPSLDKVNVWPGYGIYGDDQSVEGWEKFLTGNTGTISLANKNTVRISLNTLSDTQGAWTTTLANSDIIVDCSNPKNPTVSAFVKGTLPTESTPKNAIIDSKYTLQVPIHSSSTGTSAAYIKDYSNPYKPQTAATITDFDGMAIVVHNNLAYATDRTKNLKIVKIYDSPSEFVVSEITVKDDKGNIAETVAPGKLTAYSEIYNPGKARSAVIIMGMYDTFTNKLDWAQSKVVSVPTGYSTISDAVDMEQLDNYSAYTKYLRVFIWDTANSAQPLIESKKIDAVTVNGTSFDFWLPENTQTVKGLMLIHRHGMGESLKEMEAFKALCSKNDLAIMSFIDEEGLLKNFKDYNQCGEVILNQIAVYAEETGHPELNTVPLATFGHSNSTAFAAGFADYLPERVFAVIAYKSANSQQIEHDRIANNNIPMLIITGETDYAFGYADQIYAAERMLENGGLIQYVQDPNAGHGPNGWMSNTIMFEFLDRACQAKLSSPKNELIAINPQSGLYGYGSYTPEENSETRYGYSYKFIPEGYLTYDEYIAKKAEDADFKAHAWLFDKDYADKWMTFNANGIIDVDYAWHD